MRATVYSPIGYYTAQGSQGHGVSDFYSPLDFDSPRCFLFLLPNHTNILVCFFCVPYSVTSLKYTFLNTPDRNTSCCSLPRGSNNDNYQKQH